MKRTARLYIIPTALLLLGVAASCKNHHDKGSQVEATQRSATRPPDTLSRSEALADVVNDIAAYPSVDAEFTGIGSIRSKQYQRLEWLSKYPSERELLALTDHPNSKVKAYAFWALVNRKSGSVKPVLEKHLPDSSSFSYMSGCLLSKKQLNRFCLDKAARLLSKREKEQYTGKLKTFYGKEQ